MKNIHHRPSITYTRIRQNWISRKLEHSWDLTLQTLCEYSELGELVISSRIYVFSVFFTVSVTSVLFKYNSRIPWLMQSVFFPLSFSEPLVPCMVIPNNLHQRNCGYPMPLMKNLATLWMVKQRSDYPYRCEKCGKGYQHRGTLLRHTRHECGKEPQFKCPYCAHRSKQRGNLYQHIRTNHPGKNVFSTSN